ncbi:MAG: cupin domain-containing protein [Pseudomonadota bacterium]
MNDQPGQAIATLQTENERVIVTEWRFPPGTATGHHVHAYDYVVVPMIGGALTIAEDDGTRHQKTIVTGQSYAGPKGVSHDVINETGAEIVFVEIELK